jgi:hypothetical protein
MLDDVVIAVWAAPMRTTGFVMVQSAKVLAAAANDE